MKPEEIKFTIDQLRKDKIIYAIEACAVNIACLLGMVVAQLLPLPSGLLITVVTVIPAVGIIYTLYMGISNWRRLQRIRKLEKQLKLNISMYL
jgi:arginine exporter protein ArgO